MATRDAEKTSLRERCIGTSEGWRHGGPRRSTRPAKRRARGAWGSPGPRQEAGPVPHPVPPGSQGILGGRTPRRRRRGTHVAPGCAIAPPGRRRRGTRSGCQGVESRHGPRDPGRGAWARGRGAASFFALAWPARGGGARRARGDHRYPGAFNVFPLVDWPSGVARRARLRGPRLGRARPRERGRRGGRAPPKGHALRGGRRPRDEVEGRGPPDAARLRRRGDCHAGADVGARRA